MAQFLFAKNVLLISQNKKYLKNIFDIAQTMKQLP